MKDIDGLDDKLHEKIPHYQKEYGASNLEMAEILLKLHWEYFEKVIAEEYIDKNK